MSATISSPLIFAAAIVVALIIVALLIRARLPVLAKIGLALAALLLLFAAGGIRVNWSAAPEVVVMVDLSPSTRTASYRDPAALRARIDQLLPGIEHRLISFAREDSSEIEDSAQRLDDVPVGETKFSPPAVDAVILFGDGQFEIAANSPPVFAVVDPGIVNGGDASIQSVEIRDGIAVAHVSNRGGDRTLSWAAVDQSNVSRGSYAIESAVSEGDNSVAARLNAGDEWPENDAGAAMRAARPNERTWIGSSAPNGWRGHDGDEVISDPSLLLDSSVVTLAASADQLSPPAREAIVSYVRDLGGTLILRGGANGFAAGGFTGTPIDAISPLASSPPEPTRQWILVVDASGSMAAAVDGSTRFDRAVAAMKALIGNLPPADSVRIGSIAEQFIPWGAPRLAAELSKHAAPPANLTPRGPTNLEPFLRSLVGEKSLLPREVVIITDGEAEIADSTALAAALRAVGVRPHVLLIGDETRRTAIQELITAADGQFRGERDARNWSTSLRALVRAAMGERTIAASASVSFEQPIDSAVSIQILNQTWMRDATLLAQINHDNQRWPVAAEWRAGAGRVIALAFEADGGLIDRVAAAFAAPPRDPRFSVSLQPRAEMLIELIARDQSRPLNLLRAALRPVAGGDAIPLRQAAPGTYHATPQRADVPRAFEVLVDGKPIDRIVLPPKYAREFDEIGLNRANLLALTERFGGAVIEADDVRPIGLPARTHSRSITGACAAAGAILFLATLIYLRLR